MKATRPSFDLKAGRAEQHIEEFETMLDGYSDSRPYTVRTTRERKNKPPVHRLHFTRQPDDTTSAVLADAVYNMRSGLDHLAAALVPSKDRDSSSFPIYFQGVWEPAVEGENTERLKTRSRWTSTTRHMHPDAVAILKAIQPDDLIANETQDAPVHAFRLLNRISNTDRHTKLPLISTALRPTTVSVMHQGQRVWLAATQAEWTGDALVDDAEIRLPYGAVDVELNGTPCVFVSLAQPQWDIEVPDALRTTLAAMKDIIARLRPFLRTGSHPRTARN